MLGRSAGGMTPCRRDDANRSNPALRAPSRGGRIRRGRAARLRRRRDGQAVGERVAAHQHRAGLRDGARRSSRRWRRRTFPPRERATIAEVLRDLVAHLHTELARRYAGKAQPAVERELEAAEQAIALWQGLWEQYSTCLKPLLEGDPELAGVKPKILQRGLYVGKQLVLAHGLARRTVPGSCGTSCMPTTGSRRCSTARSPRSPTTCSRTRSASPAIRPTAMRCCSGSPTLARCR